MATLPMNLQSGLSSLRIPIVQTGNTFKKEQPDGPKIEILSEKIDSLVQEKFKSTSNFNEKVTHPVKPCHSLNPLLSSSQINNSAVVKLPNYTSVHINEQGEVFYLTPIGGGDIRQYNKNLDDYTKACLEISLEMAYNDKGHLINGEEIINYSIAKKLDKLHAKEHIVNLWIQACHFETVA